MAESLVFNCDCVSAMREMPDKCFDVGFADFPYGNDTNYDVFVDTRENLVALINDVMPELLRVCDRVAITPGVSNMYLYPAPDWVMCWYSPAGIGSSKWGFCCWQPILIYGDDPYLKNLLGRRPDSFSWGKNDNDLTNEFHPCPKPIKVMEIILNRMCIGNEKVIDPFCGSGTTRIAAHNLGLDFTGYEISPTYHALQEKRFQQHISQPKLFSPSELTHTKIEQKKIF